MPVFPHDTRHGYIAVIERAVHGGTLTLEKMERDTAGFSRAALYKGMANVHPEVATRAFYADLEVPNGKVDWTEKPPEMKGWPGPNEVRVSGTPAELVDRLFDSPRNVYSVVGPMIGYHLQSGGAWPTEVFKKLQRTVLEKSWFQVDEWRVSGHAFVGYSSAAYGDLKDGYPGSEWHSICTLNMFVLAAGRKKWMGCPPDSPHPPPDLDEPVSGGGEWFSDQGPGEFDSVCVEPGDVLVNPPFEWHRILNDEGLSCGCAFRVRDVAYLARLAEKRLPIIGRDLGVAKGRIEETRRTFVEIARTWGPDEAEYGTSHLVTSAYYASRDPRRARYLLPLVEHNAIGAWMRSSQLSSAPAPTDGAPASKPAPASEPKAPRSEGASPDRFVELYLAKSLPFPLSGGWSIERVEPFATQDSVDLCLRHSDGRALTLFVEPASSAHAAFAKTRDLKVGYYPHGENVSAGECADALGVLLARIRAVEAKVSAAEAASAYPA